MPFPPFVASTGSQGLPGAGSFPARAKLKSGLGAGGVAPCLPLSPCWWEGRFD